MTTDIICPHCGISRAHEYIGMSSEIGSDVVTDGDPYIMRCEVCGSCVMITYPPA